MLQLCPDATILLAPHSFEPAGWAIFRGIIAVYCFFALLVFTAYAGYSQASLYRSHGSPVQETVIANTQLETSSYLLTVAMV